MKSSAKNYLTSFYFIFSFLLVFLESQNLLGFIHKVSQITTIPIRSILYQARVNVLSPLSFNTIKEEIKQINTLKSKNADLESQILGLQSLKEENIQMRRLLDTGLPATWKFSPARVVTVYGDSVYLLSDTIPEVGTPVIISLDIENKISEQSVGLTGVYVGRVQNIVGNQIKVDLATNTVSKIPVITRSVVTRERQATGILKGRTGKVVLEQVLATENLQEGDLITTSGDAGFPPDLLVGYVGKVLGNGSSTLKQSEVKLAFQPSIILYAFLISKY